MPRSGGGRGGVGCIVVLLVLLAFGVAGVVGYCQQNQPGPRRGRAMLDAVHVPASWRQPGGGSRGPNERYYPANSGKPPFREPYNRWTRWYLASDWSLAGAFHAYEAAAGRAGWQSYPCSTRDLPSYRLRACWKRPNFMLTADFVGPVASCDRTRANCDTEIYVELAERTAG
jgi:hypothetical protein